MLLARWPVTPPLAEAAIARGAASRPRRTLVRRRGPSLRAVSARHSAASQGRASHRSGKTESGCGRGEGCQRGWQRGCRPGLRPGLRPRRLPVCVAGGPSEQTLGCLPRTGLGCKQRRQSWRPASRVVQAVLRHHRHCCCHGGWGRERPMRRRLRGGPPGQCGAGSAPPMRQVRGRAQTCMHYDCTARVRRRDRPP